MILEGMEIVKEVKIVFKKGYDVSSVAIFVSTLVYNVILEKSHVHQERGATKPSDLADVLFQI